MGVYRFADVKVQIEPIHDEVPRQCRGYEADGPADWVVSVDPAEIREEQRKSEREARKEGIPVQVYSDGYLESLAVYRKIAERMPERDTVLFHGSAVAVDGAAYIFTARSGTGKSTHARLWRELLGDRAVMVNDDKPLIRVDPDGTAVVYGTPWDGKLHLSRNIAVPVRGICILERAAENWIREIAKGEALPMLVQQTYRPADPGALAKTLALLDRLNVKLYRLGCNMEIGAAELSYHTMKEG